MDSASISVLSNENLVTLCIHLPPPAFNTVTALFNAFHLTGDPDDLRSALKLKKAGETRGVLVCLHRESVELAGGKNCGTPCASFHSN